MGHLGPSYGMDFDRDYPSYNLNNINVGGNSAGMNDISALAAAASDQLYELERHEAFRRAEFEMRHRQIASARKSNGNSPSATPITGGHNGTANANASNSHGNSGPYGLTSGERDRFSLHGVSTPDGGRMVYPVSSAQPANGNQPAVPSGTLADPTYLVPPTCCHEECHKSYRKRLKYAKQTQACPNCLTQTHSHGVHGGHNGVGGGGAGGGGGGGSGSGHHSSGSNTPKDRSNVNSHDDLTKLAGGGGGGGGMGGASAYNLHQASLHSQLAKLQQQHLAALQQARSRRQSGHGSGHAHGSMQIRPHALQHQHHSALPSAAVSANPSPASSDSEDDDEPMPHPNFEMHDHHPVTNSLKQMSLFHHRTAPTSAVTSPIHSRNPSRAGSPVEGHSANSGKHGHGSHQARDAKHRSHPYGSSSSAAAAHHALHSHSHHAHFSVPNSPRMHAANAKHRLSPPDIARSLSGGGGMPRQQTVEDILNSSAIPPPPSHSDRMLPPPNSSASFNSTAPSMSYSLSSNPTSAQASPNTSRASSPTISTSAAAAAAAAAAHHPSSLAHGVRKAFGMTPISASSSPSNSYSGGGGGVGGRENKPFSSFSPPTQHKLAPMGTSSSPYGHGHGVHASGRGLGHQIALGSGSDRLSSLSRGNSPVHHAMEMEVDGQA